MDYGTWYVFMYYKYSKQKVFMWEKQTPVGAEKDHHHPFPRSLRQSHWLSLGSLTARWCLIRGASLCPGLAALGSLCWALPSPPSFPVAPQAPPKEECRFQVCRELAGRTVYVALKVNNKS